VTFRGYIADDGLWAIWVRFGEKEELGNGNGEREREQRRRWGYTYCEVKDTDIERQGRGEPGECMGQAMDGCGLGWRGRILVCLFHDIAHVVTKSSGATGALRMMVVRKGRGYLLIVQSELKASALSLRI
jgi:hypothetical protein